MKTGVLAARFHGKDIGVAGAGTFDGNQLVRVDAVLGAALDD